MTTENEAIQLCLNFSAQDDDLNVCATHHQSNVIPFAFYVPSVNKKIENSISKKDIYKAIADHANTLKW